MATRPVPCPPEPAGFKFEKSDLVIDSGTALNAQMMVSLKDFEMEVSAFSKVNLNLAPGTCSFLSQTDIVDPSGFVNFIVFKGIYPDDVLPKDRWVTWEYQGKTYYMGEIMILSGPNITTVDSGEIGWNLSFPGPVYQNGGIKICNSHTGKRVRVEIMVCRQ
jgi:hypothetical protein